MARRYSDVFGASHEALMAEGALDAFVDIDSPFHVDPYLLRETTVPELAPSYGRFRQHFEEVLRLLDASKRPYDPMFREAVRKLQFRELPNASLGYSKNTSAGSGIGRGLAVRLANTASQIVQAGIKDPVIFELVGLFEEGIGADRISDMTIRVILPDLLGFSQRVAANLGIETRHFDYQEESFGLPHDGMSHEPVVLVPLELLRDLPVAEDWSDVDRVCTHNAQLRRAVNRIIGSTWKHATRRVRKSDLKGVLIHHPELLQDLIDQYQAKPASHYDFKKDPSGVMSWHDAAREYAGRFPLDLGVDRVASSAQLLDVVRKICAHFQQLIELNGLNRLLYDDSRKLRHESYAQLLFFGIADVYCEANNLDVSREPNAGRGPVDFKVSEGYKARTTVEVKYSSNRSLRRGYTTQLPIYSEAERTHNSIYLIIRTNGSSRAINAVMKLREEKLAQGDGAPEIILVDGRLKPSASKA